MNTLSIERLAGLEPSLYEEDSYHFLQYYQSSKDWYAYDSDSLGINTVVALANTFCAFHGKISFPDTADIKDTYWSTVPLGVFKFKLLADMSCGLALPANKTPGYIVTGVYWENGFTYVVYDNDKIIQVKLYVDQYTKRTRDYPEVSYL